MRWLLIGLFACPFYVSSVVAQQVLTPLPSYTPATCPTAGCVCFALDDKQALCRVVEEEAVRYVVGRGAETVDIWQRPTSFFATEPAAVQVLRGELDGRVPEEVVIAHLNGVSNGLGVHYWTLAILPMLGETVTAPLTFDTVEWGPEGFAQRTDRGVALLTAAWLDMPDPDSRRASGLYLIGRSYRYADGALVPDVPAPMRARRYLFRFQDERGATADAPDIPARWLAHRSTHHLTQDPYLRGAEHIEEAGTVVGVERLDGGDGLDGLLRLTVERADGTRTRLVYAAYNPVDEPVAPVIGDQATRRLYPDAYLPSDPAAWLMGRSVRLVRYGDEDSYLRVLWLASR